MEALQVESWVLTARVLGNSHRDHRSSSDTGKDVCMYVYMCMGSSSTSRCPCQPRKLTWNEVRDQIPSVSKSRSKSILWATAWFWKYSKLFFLVLLSTKIRSGFLSIMCMKQNMFGWWPARRWQLLARWAQFFFCKYPDGVIGTSIYWLPASSFLELISDSHCRGTIKYQWPFQIVIDDFEGF